MIFQVRAQPCPGHLEATFGAYATVFKSMLEVALATVSASVAAARQVNVAT